MEDPRQQERPAPGETTPRPSGGPQAAVRGFRATLCPSDSQLTAFLNGEMSDEEMAAVGRHLDVCEHCAKRADSDAQQALLGDEVRWAAKLRERTSLDVAMPLRRLNERLPDYEIIREIGRGGMGVVYEARQRRLNRRVAVKVLPALVGAVHPDAQSRFLREAELAASLKHTNIVAVHDCGEVDGTLYYAMELMAGPSLRDILREIRETGTAGVMLGAEASSPSSIREPAPPRRGAGFAPAEAVAEPAIQPAGAHATPRSGRAYYRCVARWIAEVAEALDYAHERGVIHRDVKPSNLLFAADGRLMISDFGLARTPGAESLTAARSMMGTAPYMSPEQIDDSLGAIDRRVDVYGLGATMYEMLALRPLFTGTDDREVLSHVLTRKPIPPHRFSPGVPWELEIICLRSVEKDRDGRYATAKEMADDLRRWLLDLPIHAKRPSTLCRTIKFTRRHKVPMILAAHLLAALIVATFLFAGLRRARDRAESLTAVAQSQGVELLLVDAQTRWHDGRLSSALARVDEGLARDPENLRLRLLRARVLMQMDRADEAVADLERLTARRPDGWQVHYLLFSIYNDLQDGAQAAHHRQQVEQLMPDSAEAYYVQACGEADVQRAIRLLTQAIDLESDRFEFFFERAWRHEQAGDCGAMLLDAERAVVLRNGWAAPHYQRGLALWSLGRREEAERAFHRAIELDAESAAPWFRRGAAKAVMGRYREAIEDLDKAIQLDPDYDPPYEVRALAYLGLGRVESARADIARAIEIDPACASYYHDRGLVSQSLDRWSDSIADFTRAIQLAPDDSLAYEDRALAYEEVGRFDNAIADVTRHIELQPLDVDAHRERAGMFAATGEYAHAILDCSRAIELAPEAADVRLFRADLYLRTSQYYLAVSDLTRAIELQPGEPIAILERGMVYEIAGRPDLALADYDRAAEPPGLAGEYAKLWTYILLRDMGQDDAAADILAARTSEEAGSWTNRLFTLASGGLADDDLVASAETEDQRAEAYYYIARKAMREDRRADATEAFRQSAAMNRDGLIETAFARAHLARLQTQGTCANGMEGKRSEGL